MCFIIIYPRLVEASLTTGWSIARSLNLAAFCLVRRTACRYTQLSCSFTAANRPWPWRRSGLAQGGRSRPHPTCVTPHAPLPHTHVCLSPQFFEASLILALRIKPMRNGWKEMERQRETSWERTKSFELCWEFCLHWPTVRHLREICVTLYFSVWGLVIWSTWMEEELFEVTHVRRFFWNLNERLGTVVLLLKITALSYFVTVGDWASSLNFFFSHKKPNLT